MIKFLAFTLRMFLDQRGEVGVEDDSDSEDDDVIVIDSDELEDEEETEEDEEEGEEDPEKEKEPEEDLKAEIAKRDALLKKQEATIKEHNRNLYGMRKKFKELETKDTDKDVKFTDDQLMGMLDEHQDDPRTMLQIIKQVAKQEAGDEAKSLVDASEMVKRKKEFDDYLLTSWPKAYEDGSKDQQDLQQAKDYLNLNDHPMGDYLAGAATMFLQMPDMLESARKEAREGAVKVEDNRKKTIKQTSLETGKKKPVTTELDSAYRSTAKQLNLSKSQMKIYGEILKKGKNTTATVEV